jgi:hypothetical protein
MEDQEQSDETSKPTEVVVVVVLQLRFCRYERLLGFFGHLIFTIPALVCDSTGASTYYCSNQDSI